jgi:iron complex transport system substrate-binding protein
MKNRIIVVQICFLFLAILPAKAVSTSFPLTLSDGMGGTVTLPRRPERIVSLAPNVTEILFAVGAGDRVVGVTRFCNYPPEVSALPKIGGYTDMSLERILALRPDLVVASRGNPRPNIETIRRHGLTVIGVQPQSINEVTEAIVRVGCATGDPERAQSVVRKMEASIESVHSRVADVPSRPRVYFGSISAPYFAAGPESFVGRVMKEAGGENIARDGGKTWPTLSIETILQRDPEVVIVGFHEPVAGDDARERLLKRLRKDRVWANISAVRTGRVYLIDEDIVHRAGPRIAQAVAEMATLFYPERSPDRGPTKPD